MQTAEGRTYIDDFLVGIGGSSNKIFENKVTCIFQDMGKEPTG